MKKIILTLTVLTLVVSPLMIFGVEWPDDYGETPRVDGLDGFLQAIVRVTDVLFVLLILLTTAFVIFAAYLFLTAAGDDDKIKKARKVVIYAIVAVVVALIAAGLPRIVANFMDIEIGGAGAATSLFLA